MYPGLTKAGAEVEDGEPVERVPADSAHRCDQHDAGEEREVLHAVQMGSIETPHDTTVIGNTEVPNGAAGREMPEPHNRKRDDEGDGPEYDRDEAPERNGHRM